METKCWQIKIALDLYLLDFWSKLTRKITFIANHWRAFLQNKHTHREELIQRKFQYVNTIIKQ